MYNTQPILPGAGFCLFSTLSSLWNEFFLVNILDTVIGILQLAKPKGTVGVSTVTRRKTSAFSNNPPPQRLLRYEFDDIKITMNCPMGQVVKSDWTINYNHDVSGFARFKF